MMRAGLGLLRLPPKDFWSMTPRELALMLGVHTRASNAPSRQQFETLMQAFPDRERNNE